MITILWNSFSHSKTNDFRKFQKTRDIKYTLHKALLTILSLVCIYGWMKQDKEVTYHLSFCSNPECCCIHIHHHIMIIYDLTACFSLVSLFFTQLCGSFFFFYHRCAVCVIWNHWLWALIKLFWCLVLSRVGDFVNVFLTTGFCTFEIKRWKVSRNVASQMWKIITCNSLSENAKSFSSCFFFFFLFLMETSYGFRIKMVGGMDQFTCCGIFLHTALARDKIVSDNLENLWPDPKKDTKCWCGKLIMEILLFCIDLFPSVSIYFCATISENSNLFENACIFVFVFFYVM